MVGGEAEKAREWDQGAHQEGEEVLEGISTLVLRDKMRRTVSPRAGQNRSDAAREEDCPERLKKGLKD